MTIRRITTRCSCSRTTSTNRSRCAGGTTFHFVTDGIESALERAFEAADGADVRLGGGAATVREYLRAGLSTMLHFPMAPVLLGAGERLFDDDLGARGSTVTSVAEVVPGEGATHVVRAPCARRCGRVGGLGGVSRRWRGRRASRRWAAMVTPASEPSSNAPITPSPTPSPTHTYHSDLSLIAIAVMSRKIPIITGSETSTVLTIVMNKPRSASFSAASDCSNRLDPFASGTATSVLMMPSRSGEVT